MTVQVFHCGYWNFLVASHTSISQTWTKLLQVLLAVISSVDEDSAIFCRPRWEPLVLLLLHSTARLPSR